MLQIKEVIKSQIVLASENKVFQSNSLHPKGIFKLKERLESAFKLLTPTKIIVNLKVYEIHCDSFDLHTRITKWYRYPAQ